MGWGRHVKHGCSIDLKIYFLYNSTEFHFKCVRNALGKVGIVFTFFVFQKIQNNHECAFIIIFGLVDIYIYI